jgi:hypothetical protein
VRQKFQLFALSTMTVLALAGCGPASTPAASGASPASSGSASPPPTSAPSASATSTLAATPTATPAPTPTAWPTGIPGALAYVKAYEDAIVAGDCKTAWNMLDAVWQANWTDEGAFDTACSQQVASTGETFFLTANPSNMMGLADWLSGMAYPGPTPTVDMAHAVLVEVDWTKLQGNNAGWDMWVANPVPGGWEIFQVR